MPKPFYVGVDIQSAGVAWATMPVPQTGFIKLPKYNGKKPHKQRTARLAFLHNINQHYPFNAGPVAVYIENPYGQSRGAQSTLNQLLGTFVGSLAVADIPVIMINTSTWKDSIFRSRSKGVPAEKRGKEEILPKATLLLGHEPPTQDEADALLIAQAAQIRYSGGLDTWT